MTIDRRAFNRMLLTGAGLAGAGMFAPFPTFASGETPRRGGTLTFLLETEPGALVTVTTTDNVTKVSHKISDGLLGYDFDLNPVPQLATEWSISDSGLEYTFKLREGVKWHDGRDFTSEDVAFSILLLKESHPRGRATFAPVREVRTPDPHTAVVVLDRPAPYLLHAFYADESPIVPKHRYEPGQKAHESPNATAPIGTGPFKFVEWRRGSHIVLERNPDYWDQPKPYVDRVVFRIITDASARAVAFETGEVDIGPDSTVPLSEIERIRGLPNISVEQRGYNFYAGVRRIEFNLSNPYFKHLKVRQAVAHAIDRAAIRDTIWYGIGQIIYGPISPDLPNFYTDDRPKYPYDVATAEKLLDEAGFPRDANGIRFELTHDFRPWNEGDKRTGEYLKFALGQVGIDVTVRSQDMATYVKRVYTERDFDFTSNSMTNSFDPVIGVQRLYWSKNFKPGVPFSNGSGYNNPEVDRILETAAVETDRAKRQQLYYEFQRLVATDLPDINFLSQPGFTLANKRVLGHTTGATGISGNLADAYIAEGA